MARILSKGEKPLDWVGSSKRDFLGFPEPVKDEMGNAIGLAQFGGQHPSAKAWKSPKGVKTAKLDVDLVERRLKVAQQDYEVRYGKAKR
jgi:hypothetical protein